MHAWATVGLVVVAAGWLPIIAYFLRNYRDRRNPISLAMCGTFSVLIYSDVVATFWHGSVDRDWAALTVRGLELLSMILFYLSLHWAKRFRSTRRPEPPQEPTP